MSDLLDKLAECLDQLGTKYTLKDGWLRFDARSRQVRTKFTLQVTEPVEDQIVIFSDYIPPIDWHSKPVSFKERFRRLVYTFSERNSDGVYYQLDSETGRIRVEGFFFAPNEKLCRVFRHFYTEIANKMDHLESDIRDLIEDP